MEIVIILFFWFVISGAIGAAIGDLGGKGNGGTGFILGGLLGPIGWIIAAIIPANAENPQVKTNKASSMTPADQAKLAELESQIAALKQRTSTPAASKVISSDDDGDIPTYKLD